MGEDMKLVKGSAPIDVTEWNWSEDPALDKLIAKAVSEGLTNCFEDHPPVLSLPVHWENGEDGWGGKQPKDPATIYLMLPLNKDDEYSCRWSLSLSDLIQYEFFWETIYDNEPYVANEGAKKLAKRLRELADELETGPASIPDIKDQLICAECNKPIAVKRDARTNDLRPGRWISNKDNMFPQYWHQGCWNTFTRLTREVEGSPSPA